MTDMYMAAADNPIARQVFKDWDWQNNPVAMLASFAYIDRWYVNLNDSQFKPRRTMLDSGAFTAYHSGKPIDLDALCAEAKKPGWDEIVGLDVIGDPEASVKNAWAMKDRGVIAMPIFHIGDPWEHLEEYVQHWPKVGLSCRFGEPMKESYRFYEQCFARAWPARFHSFGWVSEQMMMEFPFHSVDAASWTLAPIYRRAPITRHGRMKMDQLSTSNERLLDVARQFVFRYLDRERNMKRLWRRQMDELAQLSMTTGKAG